MQWLFFALLPRALWAVNNVVDKALVANKIRQPTVYLFITVAVSALVVVAVPFRGLAIPSAALVGLALFTGAIYAYALWPYYKALTFEEASRTVSLWHTVPIFVLLISSLTIGERFDGYDYIAFSLLVAGGFLITTRRDYGRFRISGAFWLMLASCVAYAFELVLAKYVYLKMPYLDGFIWIRLGSVVALLPLLLSRPFRQALKGTFSSLEPAVKGIVAGNEGLALVAIASFEYAVSLGSVSLTSALGGIQPFILLVYVMLLSRWKPEWLREELARGVWVVKLIAVLLIAVGVYFISIV